MLSPSAAWTREMRRATVRPRFYVKIYDGTDSWFFYSGPVTFAQAADGSDDFPQSVDDVSPVSWAIDPLTRKQAVSSVNVRFAADGHFRSIFIANRLHGQQVDIYVGPDNIDVSGWQPYLLNGVISRVDENTDQTFDVTVDNGFGILRDRNITGAYVGHPLEIIEDVVGDLDIPAAMIDSSSLDPSDADYAAISHYVAFRGGRAGYKWLSIQEPTSALAVIDSLGLLMNGQLHIKEDGKFAFKAFDSTASTVASWTKDDIGDLRVTDPGTNVINRAMVNFFLSEREDGGQSFTYQHNDTASQTNYAYPGEAKRIIERIFDMDWQNGASELQAEIPSNDSPDVGETFTLKGKALYGMAGTRNPNWLLNTPGAQPADAQLSATRLAYLRIGSEIISCDLVSAPNGTTTYVNQGKDAFQFTIPAPSQFTYRVKERGALGTTAAAHAVDSFVVDMTMAVNLARDIIERYSDGAPTIEVDTGLDQYAVQIGDLVDITWDRYASYGKDGLTSSTKWEVVGKQVDVLGDAPHIKWVLVWAYDGSVPTPTETSLEFEIVYSGGRDSEYYDSVWGKYTVGAKIDSGFTVTDAGGTDITIAPGSSDSVGKGDHPADSETLNVSKDTYIYVDPERASRVIRETANGAGAPNSGRGEILIATVVTDGAGITSITDNRPLTNIDGVTLDGKTVDTTEIADDAIQDLQVDAAAITPRALSAGSANKSLTLNGDFGSFSRG